VHQHGIRIHQYDPHPRLGRHQILDARSLPFIHRHHGGSLKPALWQPKTPVLDQQDLLAQGINVASLVPGGVPGTDALGSCTGNAGTAALSTVLTAVQCEAAGLSLTDPAAAEQFAIRLYAEATRQDEWLAQQWPPTDCGSSGLGVARALRARGLVGSYVHAADADGIASLLQSGPLMLGMPWYNAWFEPPGSGAFVDDAPYWSTSGLAGGHEVCAVGLETVVQDTSGRVVPERTVLLIRNSWSRSWGDQGHFRMRLSTYTSQRRQIDVQQLRLAS